MSVVDFGRGTSRRGRRCGELLDIPGVVLLDAEGNRDSKLGRCGAERDHGPEETGDPPELPGRAGRLQARESWGWRRGREDALCA